jgi:hypothetical protein
MGLFPYRWYRLFHQCGEGKRRVLWSRPDPAGRTGDPPDRLLRLAPNGAKQACFAADMAPPGREAPSAASNPRLRLLNLSAPSPATVTVGRRVNKGITPSYPLVNTDPTDRSGTATGSGRIRIKKRDPVKRHRPSATPSAEGV